MQSYLYHSWGQAQKPIPGLLVPSLLVCAGCTPHPDDALGKAAVEGDLTERNRLLAQRPSISDRESALVWAARFGQPASISILVKDGADPNTQWA